MCVFIAQIILFIGGIYGLVSGKLPLTKNMKLEGNRARITGGILLLPLPVSFCLGLVLGVIAASSSQPNEVLAYAAFIDIPVLLASIALAVGYALMTQPKDAGAA